MSDASQAARGARAEAWRRAYAMIIDIDVVSAAVSFIGPPLFNPTDARTRVLFVLAHYLLPARYWHPHVNGIDHKHAFVLPRQRPQHA
jgi:hypothetical protein